MPPTATTLVVSAALVVAALVALAASGVLRLGPVWLSKIAALGAGLVFLARGIGGYFFSKIAWTPVEPFASLNLWLYSPLCVAIGLSFLALVLTANPLHRKH